MFGVNEQAMRNLKILETFEDGNQILFNILLNKRIAEELETDPDYDPETLPEDEKLRIVNQHKERVERKIYRLKDQKGRTPLHLVCYKGYAEFARILIARHSALELDMHTLDYQDNTPLLLACSHGYDHYKAEMSDYQDFLDRKSSIVINLLSPPAKQSDDTQNQYESGSNRDTNANNVKPVRESEMNDEDFLSFRKILKRSCISGRNTPLHWAIYWGDIRGGKHIFKVYPFIILKKNDTGKTPLEIAFDKVIRSSNKKQSKALIRDIIEQFVTMLFYNETQLVELGLDGKDLGKFKKIQRLKNKDEHVIYDTLKLLGRLKFQRNKELIGNMFMNLGAGLGINVNTQGDTQGGFIAMGSENLVEKEEAEKGEAFANEEEDPQEDVIEIKSENDDSAGEGNEEYKLGSKLGNWTPGMEENVQPPEQPRDSTSQSEDFVSDLENREEPKQGYVHDLNQFEKQDDDQEEVQNLKLEQALRDAKQRKDNEDNQTKKSLSDFTDKTFSEDDTEGDEIESEIEISVTESDEENRAHIDQGDPDWKPELSETQRHLYIYHRNDPMLSNKYLTLLHKLMVLAVYIKDLKVIKLLIDSFSLNPFFRVVNGKSAIHMAAHKGRPIIAHYLLKQKYKYINYKSKKFKREKVLNKPDKIEYNNLLHLAVREEDIDIVNDLLDNNVSYKAFNYKNFQPFDMSKKISMLKKAKILMKSKEREHIENQNSFFALNKYNSTAFGKIFFEVLFSRK